MSSGRGQRFRTGPHVSQAVDAVSSKQSIVKSGFCSQAPAKQGRVCQAAPVAASTSLSCFSLIIYLWQEVNTERRVGGREKRRSSLTFDTGWKRRSCAELGVCLLSAHLVSTEPLRSGEEEHCSIQRQYLENREK